MLRNLVRFSWIPRINCSYAISRDKTCNLYWLNSPSVYYYEQNKSICSDQVRYGLLRPSSFNVIKDNVRFKSKDRKSRIIEDDSDEEDEIDEEGYDGDGNKFRQIKLKSLRCDNILMKTMGFTRRKTEDLFLGSKLKYNDKPLPKKSVEVKEGDSLEVCTDPVDTGGRTETVAKLNVVKIRPLAETSTYIMTFTVDKSG